jgi:hypothetical protein
MLLFQDYPLPGVIIHEADNVRVVKDPLYKGWNCQAGPSEYAMQMQEVGSFYACNGNEVEYSVETNADPGWVRLCLEGQVLVALLHQRKIINFHASSFIYNGNGIMILGDTGAGKSSLTAAFTLDGGGFLSDDLTPVILNGGRPFIMPLTRRIKLEEDSVEQLRITKERLKKAEEGTGKYFLDIEHAGVDSFGLDYIFKIETGGDKLPLFSEPDQTDKFSVLRSEICLWEILAGMPETEKEYLYQTLQLVKQVHIVRLVRPATIEIKTLQATIKEYLEDRR